MESQKNIRLRAAIVLVENNKILLMLHQKGDQQYWVLPGGGVEYGETLEEAGVRELMEETGIQIKVMNLLFISESIPPDQHRHVINFYFSAKRIGGEERLGPEPGLIGMQWHELEDLPHLLIYPQVTHEMLDALRGGDVLGTSLGNRW